VLAGTTTVALGPKDLALTEGSETIEYAIGSAQDKTLNVVAQTIAGLHSAAGQVNTGSGGLARTGEGTWQLYLLAALSATLILGGGLRLVTASAKIRR
jgi:hypothetical protein